MYSSFWNEVTLIFDSSQLLNRSYLEVSFEKIYFLKQQSELRKLNIGFPISSDLTILLSILDRYDFSFEVSTFEYIELTEKKSINHWIRKYPKLNDAKVLYFRASESTDWNSFLNSIWDLAKIGTEIRLLDSNLIFSQSNALKKINSLVMRGVILGFYPNFPKKWYQSEISVIKNMARLKLVDFWMISVPEIISNTYQKSLQRKQTYIDCLEK